MSYAIIRNANYKMNQIAMIERHNERLNHNYSNKDIDLSRSSENYHLKKILTSSYLNEFEKIREEHNLKGNLRLNGKKQSNVMCEFVITSDKEFFDTLGADGTQRFFEDAYDFVKQKVGEDFVVSAVVHKDEQTPHLHILYVPTINGKDRKGNPCKRINCSEFWKGKDSYSRLQNEYYKFITTRGYDLERGEKGSTAEHLSVAEYKLKKTEEHLQEISKKAVETKRNLAKENEYSVMLRQKSRREYTVAQQAKAEADKFKKESSQAKAEVERVKREALKIQEEATLKMRVAKLNSSMIRQMAEFNADTNRAEKEKLKSEYEYFLEMKEKFKEYAQKYITNIKDEQLRAIRKTELNKQLNSFSDNESLDEYVQRITQNNKQKQKGMSL